MFPEVFAGIDVQTLEPVCPVYDDFCGTLQQERVKLTVDGASGEVVSGNFASFGAFGAWATEVSRYVGDLQCSDTPTDWYRLALLRLTP